MQSLVQWFLDDIVLWGMVGFLGWQFLNALKESKTGHMLGIVIIAVIGYFFIKNPVEVLDNLSKIGEKFKVK